MSQTDNTKELQEAIALYGSLNKFITALKSSEAREQIEQIRSNLPDLEKNLTVLQNDAASLKLDLEKYPQKLKLPENHEENKAEKRDLLEKELNTLISENKQHLSNISISDLVTMAEYQAVLSKQLRILTETRELMDETLPTLELSIRLNKWQEDAQAFDRQTEYDLSALLKLHREYYDIFKGPEEDKNLLTPPLHHKLEAVIAKEAETKLSSTTNAAELSALIITLHANIDKERKGSPTLNAALNPLIVQALKKNAYEQFDKMKSSVQEKLLPYLAISDYQTHWASVADSAMKSANHNVDHLVELLKTYHVCFVETKNTNPDLQKMANEIQLALALSLKNDPKLATLIKTLPDNNQKEIEKIIGLHTTEPRKDITTQFGEKRPRKMTPPGEPPTYIRPDPKKPKQ